jgi:ATP-dependent RNA helicase DeaD
MDPGLEAASTLTHAIFEIARNSKFEALVNLLHWEEPEMAILFCHTKVETEGLCKKLSAQGFTAAYLNGDLPQPRRTETLEAFRAGKIKFLVATDVAARGIDV